MLFNKFIELLNFRFDNPRVLDVGCGPGKELERFRGKGIDAVGIDFAFSGDGVILGDFLKYDFGEKKFEGIFVKDVLHLFPALERKRVIKKVKNLLSEKGLVYFGLKVRDFGEGFVGELEGFRVVNKKIGRKVILGKRDLIVICVKR